MTAKNGRTGRPSKLPEVEDKIIDILKTTGCYKDTAAWYAGITPSTLVNWLKKGRDEEEGPYHDFFIAVEKAQAEADAKDLQIIRDAALKGNWQASSWRLERKNPRKWGRKDANRMMVALDDVKGLASKIILAVNRTVRSQKERIALAEQIMQAVGEVKPERPFQDDKPKNGNGKNGNGNGKKKTNGGGKGKNGGGGHSKDSKPKNGKGK